jgi:hypothetical protein
MHSEGLDMIKSYELRNEENELIRVFMSHEQALKFLTEGDYLVEKQSILPPKISLYNLAIKKVGYSSL